jgi:hypothetical protein
MRYGWYVPRLVFGRCRGGCCCQVVSSELVESLVTLVAELPRVLYLPAFRALLGPGALPTAAADVMSVPQPGGAASSLNVSVTSQPLSSMPSGRVGASTHVSNRMGGGG